MEFPKPSSEDFRVGVTSLSDGAVLVLEYNGIGLFYAVECVKSYAAAVVLGVPGYNAPDVVEERSGAEGGRLQTRLTFFKGRRLARLSPEKQGPAKRMLNFFGLAVDEADMDHAVEVDGGEGVFLWLSPWTQVQAAPELGWPRSSSAPGRQPEGWARNPKGTVAIPTAVEHTTNMWEHALFSLKQDVVQGMLLPLGLRGDGGLISVVPTANFTGLERSLLTGADAIAEYHRVSNKLFNGGRRAPIVVLASRPMQPDVPTVVPVSDARCPWVLPSGVESKWYKHDVTSVELGFFNDGNTRIVTGYRVPGREVRPLLRALTKHVVAAVTMRGDEVQELDLPVVIHEGDRHIFMMLVSKPVELAAGRLGDAGHVLALSVAMESKHLTSLGGHGNLFQPGSVLLTADGKLAITAFSTEFSLDTKDDEEVLGHLCSDKGVNDWFIDDTFVERHKAYLASLKSQRKEYTVRFEPQAGQLARRLALALGSVFGVKPQKEEGGSPTDDDSDDDSDDNSDGDPEGPRRRQRVGSLGGVYPLDPSAGRSGVNKRSRQPTMAYQIRYSTGERPFVTVVKPGA